MSTEKNRRMIVELKAKVDDLAGFRSKLIRFGAKQRGIFRQIDTYYEVPKGRLKLRQMDGKDGAKLIYYEREDTARPKRSSVFVLTVPEPKMFKHILDRIMKAQTIVEKVREIFFCEDIQVHLDKVKRLGSFIEFELESSHDAEQQKKDILRLEKLREKLDITSESLERFSYSDLI